MHNVTHSVMTSPPRVLGDFEGVWTIRRTIRHAGGATAQFEGTAVWRAARAGLDYVETGTMTLAGHAPMQAQRRYVWTKGLSVLFDDGRFFHRVPPQGGTTQHWCDPDAYELAYDFHLWPAFTVHWRVTGPLKDYIAQSEYQKQGV